MEYELVIKFWRKSLDSEAFLETLEDRLAEALGARAVLDGHDLSPKEINLFVRTSDPRPVFRRAKDVLEDLGVLHGVSAGYRVAGGASFTSIWPLRTTRRFRLP